MTVNTTQCPASEFSHLTAVNLHVSIKQSLNQLHVAQRVEL